MKHGDVLSVNNGKLLPRLICLFTGAKRSHAGIIVELCGELFFYDAAEGGTLLRPLENYLSKPGKDIAVLRPKKPVLNLWHKCKKYSGRPYGFGDLFIHHPWYIARSKVKEEPRWTGRGGHSGDKALVCTELVARIYDLPNWWRFTPKDLEDSPDFDLIREFKT